MSLATATPGTATPEPSVGEPTLPSTQPTESGSGFVSTFRFTLPRGFVDREGVVHREGTMRLATAGDEIWTQNDPMVRENSAYLSVLLLARTVVTLGELREVDARVVEGLWASDLAFLQDMYRRINTAGHTDVEVACPTCDHVFIIDVTGGDPAGG